MKANRMISGFATVMIRKTIKINAHYYAVPIDHGQISGLPEHCYPPEGGLDEVDDMYLVDADREVNENEFEDYYEDVFEAVEQYLVDNCIL